MSRGRKMRTIGFIPNNLYFYPKRKEYDSVSLTFEEVEAIRLMDYLDLDQIEASKRMNVSRGTFQRILNLARKKIAQAIVLGKGINIKGGTYNLEANGCPGRRRFLHDGMGPHFND